MKRQEIEILFTEKVASYIAQGYTINTNSMRGHQGEVAKVDLYKGKELIRVWLMDEVLPSPTYGYVLALRVGKWDYEINNNYMDYTVWFQDISVLEETIFYVVDRGKWYVESLEEYNRIEKLREDRYRGTHRSNNYELVGDKYNQIARRYMINKQGYKRISSDSLSVRKLINKRTRPIYYVDYKDSHYRLR